MPIIHYCQMKESGYKKSNYSIILIKSAHTRKARGGKDWKDLH